ncbi:hypothetical protein VE00_08055 [Pseudogymnoascus sp. WSF 3629]|nr:hypothetical protein VE00_08055 [Pseudogymnoascus sp. WSF 3629]
MSSYNDSAAYPVIGSTEGLTTGSNAGNTFTNGETPPSTSTAPTTTPTPTNPSHPGASNASNTTAKNVKETLAQGPVAENVKAEATKTTAELSALSTSRQTPSTRTATGQPLTHYHSFFGSLFSWENPRASALAYAATVVFIFAARYLDLLRYGLKLTWMALGVTVAAEVAGRALFNAGFTSQIRPRKYYTVPKATLDSMTGDLDELINFFVIESQRLLFAENVLASGAALFSAFISYHLVKIVPLWGLALIGTSVLFLGPLIYTTNKALIDGQIEQLSQIVNAQTTQVRQMASQHASNAAATTKMYVGDYSAKAQEIIGRARSSSPADRKTVEPAVTTGVNAAKVPSTSSVSPAATSTSTKKSKSKVPTTESFPKVPETDSFAPSTTTTSSIPVDTTIPSTTASNAIPATLPTYTIPPPGAALKTEGLSSSAADAAADLRFDDFPSAPKKVVNIGEDGLAREGVPSVAGIAAGLREEELLS